MGGCSVTVTEVPELEGYELFWHDEFDGDKPFHVILNLAVGYDNEKHFMKTFKAECGVSPGEYRKNMQRQ